MIRASKRSKVPGKVEGPSVGVFVTPTGIAVRVLDGSKPSAPRFTAKADSEAKADIVAAAQMVAARVKRALTVALPVSVEV